MRKLAKIESGMVANIINVTDTEPLNNWPGYQEVTSETAIQGTYDGSKYTLPSKPQDQQDMETAQAAAVAKRKPVEDRLKAVDLNSIDPIVADLIRALL